MKKIETRLATRESILDAANRVLVEKGAEGFTLDAVAKEAAISKGGLLYHFPSKNNLIQGMIARSITQVDDALREELALSGGDYLTAYVRASFRTNVEPEHVSRALFAAIANDPSLLEPLRARFFRIQGEIAAAAPTEEIGTLLRLCMDGMWYAQLYQFAPPSLELRNRMRDTLLAFLQDIKQSADLKS